MDTINPKSCVHLAECRVRLFCANVPEAGVRFQLGERVPRCERAPESARRPIFHEIEQVHKGVDKQTGSLPQQSGSGKMTFRQGGGGWGGWDEGRKIGKEIVLWHLSLVLRKRRIKLLKVFEACFTTATTNWIGYWNTTEFLTFKVRPKSLRPEV